MEHDNLFEQMGTIVKAGNYDIVAKQRDELQEENKKLKAANKGILKALSYLLSSYQADFKTITGAELNQTEAVKLAIETINKNHETK